MKRLIMFVTLFATLIAVANCANILALLGMPSPSHHIWNRALLYGLAKNNHNITVVSVDKEDNPPANVHFIHLENVYEKMFSPDATSFNMTELINQSPYVEMEMYEDYCHMACKALLETEGSKAILNYPDTFKFDLVLYDYTCGPCLLFLLKKFNYPPLVGITAFCNPPFTIDVVGGHRHHAYIPFYGLSYGSNMNFFERSYNLFIHLYSHFYRKYVFIKNQDKTVRQFVDFDFPYLEEIEQRAVLALVNSNPAIDFPEPLPPNVIPVGGLQIKAAKPLPNDLEDFINKSMKGAVLFSLGTNVKSDMLGADIQTRFLKAFEQLPNYNFLWKFETDTLPMELPKNVLVRPWLPQNDILGHPKVKAFITHSGGLSTLETSWHGVPILGIPFFVDQHRNMIQSLKAGVGEKLTYPSFTVEDIVNKLKLVLEDPRYQKNMQLRSKRFQDQKEKPLDRAVWWIEWILRNPKPGHIKSPVLTLGFIVANCLDIYVVATLVVFSTLFVFYKIINLCRRKGANKSKKD